MCDQADAGAEGAVSESSEAAVIPGPTGDIRGNSRQENKKSEFPIRCLGFSHVRNIILV